MRKPSKVYRLGKSVLHDVTSDNIENSWTMVPMHLSWRLCFCKNIFQYILTLDESNIHALHFLGLSLCEKGILKEGIAFIEQSLSLDKNRHAPFLNLGRYLIADHQFDRACDILNQAVAAKEDDYNSLYLLGKALYLTNDYQAAIASFLKAQLIKPIAQTYITALAYALSILIKIKPCIMLRQLTIIIFP